MPIDSIQQSFIQYLEPSVLGSMINLGGLIPRPVTKSYTIAHRDIQYQFSAHFHPYAGKMMEQLIRSSTAGLQSLDTKFVRNQYRPGSVEIDTRPGATAGLIPGSAITLAEDVQAINVEDGSPVTLPARLRIAMSEPFEVEFPEIASLVLVDATDPAEFARDESFTIKRDFAAVLSTAASAKLGTAATVTGLQRAAITIPASAAIVLDAGVAVTLKSGAGANLTHFEPRPELYYPFFDSTYSPSRAVSYPRPALELEFGVGGAYADCNWEVFCHVPQMIGIHLSKNGRFAEAQRWFHFCFDPGDDSDDETPDRFWKFLPFRTTDVKRMEDVLANLATGADPDLQKETINSIAAWKASPFRPHLVARFRQQSYMYKTVMAYLDNLIAWGDSLFRQDTGEAIDEAMMLYVLAENILGPRPQVVPRKGSHRSQTYAQLRGDLREFGTVLRELEVELPFDLMPIPGPSAGDGPQQIVLQSLGKTLYFGVPRNDKLLGYWDTVADRLFKIRNSLNLQGVFRQLALFEPPIDPALLVRATAAGLDVSSVINGLSAPPSPVRFQVLLQKAIELCQETKSLGSGALSSIEREDGETLQILRARHERSMLALGEEVRYSQVQEAIKSREGLFLSLANSIQRLTHYERQLGRSVEEIAGGLPEFDELDLGELAAMKLAIEEPVLTLRDVPIDIAATLEGPGGTHVSRFEAEDLDKTELSRNLQDGLKILTLAAQGMTMVPDVGINFHFWGLGGNSSVIGGSKLSAFARLTSDIASIAVDRLNYDANRASKVGGYSRREQEWAQQSNLAAGEISQLYKQIRAAQLREAIAQKEFLNFQQQVRNAQEVEYYLTGETQTDWTQTITPRDRKVTDKSLYTWLKRETLGLHNQFFQLAFDVARKAERAMQRELGDSTRTYLKFNYQEGREGLMAGEKLMLDLKRMELDFHELNTREYELTKHVSLLQLDPKALLTLRHTGFCSFSIPEILFDLEGPGHYFRRIKSVGISIPCVTGPYTSINCRLQLTKNSVRINSDSAEVDTYGFRDDNDPRFEVRRGTNETIVASSGQQDSGMFETNLRDERYLPFEYAGVISDWTLQLPADPSKGDPALFDYQTISDCILHIRYTAREGGDRLRTAAIGHVRKHLAGSTPDGALTTDAGRLRLFDVRREFPGEWAKLVKPSDDSKVDLQISPGHFGFISANNLEKIEVVSVMGKGHLVDDLTIGILGGEDERPTAPIDSVRNPPFTEVPLNAGAVQKPVRNESATVSISVGENKPTDLWLLVRWTGA